MERKIATNGDQCNMLFLTHNFKIQTVAHGRIVAKDGIF